MLGLGAAYTSSPKGSAIAMATFFRPRTIVITIAYSGVVIGQGAAKTRK